MLQSNLFYKTFKQASKGAKIKSHKLLERGGFISQLASGVYNFLPLGWRVHKKIEEIIRDQMNAIGAQELFLPTLQPKKIWEKSKRWGNMDPPLFKLEDSHGRTFALGSTHEEVITKAVKSKIESYKDLPIYLYQIQNKFRNELRATGGLLRTREFMMKDLYSFHSNEEQMEEFFQKVLRAYDKIYENCGLNAIKSEASGGDFTDKKTYEFQVPAKAGEDKVLWCKKCGWAVNLEIAQVKEGDNCPKCGKKNLKRISTIEVGHTFRLGDKYSKLFNLHFKDKDGEDKPVLMGCYGIGVGRLMGSIAEVSNDKKGIIWPKKVAPFKVHLIKIENSNNVKNQAGKIYRILQEEEIEVLYDDREGKSPGEKFAEADLIGIPYRIVVSEKTLNKNSFEIKERDKKETKLVKIKNLKKQFNN